MQTLSLKDGSIIWIFEVDSNIAVTVKKVGKYSYLFDRLIEIANRNNRITVYLHDVQINLKKGSSAKDELMKYMDYLKV